MTDIELLKQKIKESGMKMTAVAEKTGMERATLYNRLLGKGEFKVSEITALTDVLRLTPEERDAIFFAAKV